MFEITDNILLTSLFRFQLPAKIRSVDPAPLLADVFKRGDEHHTMGWDIQYQ